MVFAVSRLWMGVLLVPWVECVKRGKGQICYMVLMHTGCNQHACARTCQKELGPGGLGGGHPSVVDWWWCPTRGLLVGGKRGAPDSPDSDIHPLNTP